MKRSSYWACLAFLAIPLVACSAILGLQEPTLDNTIEGGADSATQDAPTSNDVTSSDAPIGDGGLLTATETVNARVSYIALFDDASVYYTDQLAEVVGRIGKDGTGQVDLVNGGVAGFYPVFGRSRRRRRDLVVDRRPASMREGGCGNALNIIDDNNNNNPYSTYLIALDTTVSPTMIYVAAATGNNDVLQIIKVPKGTANATPTTFISTAKTCQTLNDIRIYGSDLYFHAATGASTARRSRRASSKCSTRRRRSRRRSS